jgi:hypothetical protein
LADYRGLVTDLAGLADGHLKPDEITCVERAGKRHLTIVSAGRKYEALLEGNTDWADVPPLLVCLNEILTQARAPGRFYEQFAPTGGQEFAVAYATPDQVRALESEGCQLLHAEDKKQR